jgi:hypothetical protein
VERVRGGLKIQLRVSKDRRLARKIGALQCIATTKQYIDRAAHCVERFVSEDARHAAILSSTERRTIRQNRSDAATGPRGTG